MTSTTASRRRARAAAELATKERRQKIFVIVAAVVLVLVLAFELPKVLNRGSSSGSPATSTASIVPVAPVTPAPSTAAANAKALRAALRHPAHDVFAEVPINAPASSLAGVSNPPGLHDPFALPHSPESVSAPAAPKAPSSPLPKTIVIGKPGGGRVPQRGWIVILASIPTGQGEKAARSFASTARRTGVGQVSVLNSSNRRPLRGGYWVVYSGPFATLGAGNTAAEKIHGQGFTSAYIRELIVYRKK